MFEISRVVLGAQEEARHMLEQLGNRGKSTDFKFLHALYPIMCLSIETPIIQSIFSGSNLDG